MDQTLTIIRRPIKHARLRVREDSSVQLIIPHCFDQLLIDGLLQKKASWIAHHQQFFLNRKEARQPLATGEILLFGNSYQFVSAPELGVQVLVDDVGKEIRSGRDLTHKPILSLWYRSFAHAHLTARITGLSVQHRLPFNRLFIRSQRNKWGGCSTQGNVSLNWRLILAPNYVIDYVILHELMHTKVLNHSHNFWVMLKGICPRCGEAIQWLNANPPAI